MATEITFSEGPQNCVANRVEQDIAVRVALEPAIEGNLDTAKHQGPVGHELMGVEALADSHAQLSRSAANQL